MEAWRGMSDEKRKEIFANFMPQELTDEEKKDAVTSLLSNELVTFRVNHLEKAFLHLKISRIAPDINKTMEDVRKLKQSAQRLIEKESQLFLWKTILYQRKQLFQSSIECGPYDPIRVIDKRGSGQHRRKKIVTSNGIVPIKFKSVQNNNHQQITREKILNNHSDIHLRQILNRAFERYKKELQEVNSLVSHNHHHRQIIYDSLNNHDNLNSPQRFNLAKNGTSHSSSPSSSHQVTPVISSDDEEFVSSLMTEKSLEDSNSYPLYDLKPSRMEVTSIDSSARYRQLLQDYQKRKKKASNIFDLSKIKSEDSKPSSMSSLIDVIKRVNGVGEDKVTLVSPPSLPVAPATKRKKKKPPPKRKKKNNIDHFRPSVKDDDTVAVKKQIKKEPKSPNGLEKLELPNVVPGIEVMSRKLDLNLDSIKKEKKEGKNVFDFDEDDDVVDSKDGLSLDGLPPPKTPMLAACLSSTASISNSSLTNPHLSASKTVQTPLMTSSLASSNQSSANAQTPKISSSIVSNSVVTSTSTATRIPPSTSVSHSSPSMVSRPVTSNNLAIPPSVQTKGNKTKGNSSSILLKNQNSITVPSTSSSHLLPSTINPSPTTAGIPYPPSISGQSVVKPSQLSQVAVSTTGHSPVAVHYNNAQPFLSVIRDVFRSQPAPNLPGSIQQIVVPSSVLTSGRPAQIVLGKLFLNESVSCPIFQKY